MREEKAALRRRLRELRPDEAAAVQQSSSICTHLRSWRVLSQAGCIAAYMPLRHEADITSFLQAWLAAGKTLLLPRVNGRNMTFHTVTRLDMLMRGGYGVLEPPKDAEQVTLARAEVILVPLEAVDAAGHRLGKGGGYYDRALAGTSGYRLGVALQYQVIARVPVESGDVSLDGWVDPEGIHNKAK